MLSLEIPSDLAQQRSWLEKRLVGQDFSEFVAELQIPLRAPASTDIGTDADTSNDPVTSTSTSTCATSDDLDDVFGERVTDWLSNGLESASQQDLQCLLSHPPLLTSLQYRVFAEGGEHWKELMNCVDANPVRLSERKPKSGDAETSRSFSWLTVVLAASLLAAAIITPRMAVKTETVIAKTNATTSPGWGWSESVAEQSFESGSDYLAWVSSGAQAWFNKDAESAGEYSQRLAELRAGCQALIDSDHPALTEDQASFLVSRCKEWQIKFDRHAEQLAATPSDHKRLKQKTDQAIRNAIAVLEQMSSDLRASV